MDFDEYQYVSKQTAQGYAEPNYETEHGKMFRTMFLALALNGEAGELGEKVKKYVREDDEEYLEGARAELGDVLWYLSQLATLLDVSLEDVAEENMDKLLDRQERDAITGEGDER